MKDLRKYYAIDLKDHDGLFISRPTVYLASEADAAFAEMRRQNNNFVVELNEIIAALKQQHAEEIARYKDELESLRAMTREMVSMVNKAKGHAEEIERLKAGQRQIEMIRDWNDAHFKAIEKQAERYEKLSKLNPQQFLELWKTNLMGPRFDDLVDQLPASGQS